MGCDCACHDQGRAHGCCWNCEDEHDPLRNAKRKIQDLELQIRDIEEQKTGRKAQCVDKCNHPAEFVCDYEDGTSHCLECVAEKFWRIEDILSGKHNVHTYWGALETIAHPDRFLAKYDPAELARTALGEVTEKQNEDRCSVMQYQPPTPCGLPTPCAVHDRHLET